MELKSCGVLVVRGRPIKEFLLMEHADRLDIPKGHVDPGETDVECALRELWEETGIRSEWIELDPDYRFATEYEVRSKRSAYKPATKQLVVFLGRLVRDAKIKPTEHLGYHWRKWSPPHAIQTRTIDPLLRYTEEFFSNNHESE